MNKKRALLVSCSLLFVLGLIALIVGIFLWRSSTDNQTDNNQVEATVTPTEKPETTSKPNVTSTPSTTMTVIWDAAKSDRTYTAKSYKVLVPAGWRVVTLKSADGKTITAVEKNGYYVYFDKTEFTGGSLGYPLDGVCQANTVTSGFATAKFKRVDATFNIKASIDQSYSCNIKKSIQLGDVVWVGSRLVDKAGTANFISPSQYFGKSGKNTACQSTIFIVGYAHVSHNDSKAIYPIWGSKELNDMLSVMDRISGSMVFIDSEMCFTDTLG